MISTTYQKNVVSDYNALRAAVAKHETTADISESFEPAEIVDAGPTHVTVKTRDASNMSGTSTVTYRDLTERAHHILAVEEHQPTDFTKTRENVIRRTVDYDTGELLMHEINGRPQPLGNIAGAAPVAEPKPNVGKPILEMYHRILDALKNPPDVFRFDPLPGEQPEGTELTIGLMHVTVTDPNPEHLRTKEYDGCGCSTTSTCSYDVESDGGPYKTLVYTRETPPVAWVMGDKGEKVTHRIDMATGEVVG